MKEKRVYISGPMTGYDDYNFPAFFEAEKKLNEQGIKAFNPARFGVQESFSWKDYIVRDLKSVSASSDIHTLNGWGMSKGALCEMAFHTNDLSILSIPIQEWNDIILQVKKIKVFMVNGKKRSGKDTLSDYLVEKYDFKKYSFAKIMKEVAKVIFGWTDEYFEDTILKEKEDEFWGISPRKFLQYFGTDLMQFELPKLSESFSSKTGRNIWSKRIKLEILNQIKECDYRDIVISDFRFNLEYQQLFGLELSDSFYSAKTIKVNNNRIEDSKDSHSSENDLNNFDFDYEIDNSSSLDNYYKSIDKLFTKLIKTYY